MIGKKLKRTPSKAWYRSKTIWLNLAAFVSGVTPLLMNFEGLVEPITYALLLTFLGILNVGLRIITEEGIYVSKGETDSTGSSNP